MLVAPQLVNNLIYGSLLVFKIHWKRDKGYRRKSLITVYKYGHFDNDSMLAVFSLSENVYAV